MFTNVLCKSMEKILVWLWLCKLRKTKNVKLEIKNLISKLVLLKGMLYLCKAFQSMAVWAKLEG